MQGALGAASAAALTDLVEIPSSARRLLDVGGGEATFSIALCARHPSLTATVLDLPSVVAAGTERVAAAGLADRITLRGVDLAGELDEHDHDVLLLCNVVHGFAADRARSLVTECVRALRPGGMLLLLDTTDQPRDGLVPHVDQAFTRFFDLHLWHTQGGRVYPTATLTEWLVDAGCHVRRIDLPGFPTRMLLVAEVSATRDTSAPRVR
jgi:cyclopropane fatty-acyl-phospholipid synthase-like methyltransferase